MSGHFKVSRDVWDHPAFRPGEMTQREAFFWMLSEAAWKPHTRRLGGVVVDLDRGQLAASTRHMAKVFQWTEARVRRYLNMLSEWKIIDAASDAGVTVVTVCNYDKYQGERRSSDAPSDAAATQQRRTTDAIKKTGKQGNTEPNGSDEKARKRAHRLPEDWTLPSEWLDDATSRGLTVEQAYDQAERMRDWSRSAPASKGAKRDWRAAWRNWIKRVCDERTPPGGGGGGGYADRQRAAADAAQSAALRVAQRRMGWGANDPASGAEGHAGEHLRVVGASRPGDVAGADRAVGPALSASEPKRAGGGVVF